MFPSHAIARHHPRDDGGFTLIEMLVVLTIAALIVGLALPRLTSAEEKSTLHTAAHQVAAALRNTRSLAMISGRTEAFVLDTASGAFRAGPTASPGRLPRGIRPALVTVASDQDDAGRGRIQFFADGSSTGGGVLLAAGKIRSQVLVDWLTGRVSIAEDPMRLRPDESGFTLIEVLVATTIAALLLLPLLRGFSTGLMATTRSSGLTEATLIAQSTLETLGAQAPLDEARDLDRQEGRYHVTARIHPYSSADLMDDASLPVGPYEITVTVDWPQGSKMESISVRTLRLGPTPPGASSP